MLKLLLTIGCALLLPLLPAPAAAQAAQLGFHGFIVDNPLPANVQACRAKQNFLCFHHRENDWGGRKGHTVVGYQSPQIDAFLGSSVRVMVIHHQRKVRGVVAITGGASEQKRILSELTRRHGKPSEVAHRNIRLKARGPQHEYVLARWDLPGGEVCFHGILQPDKKDTEPAKTGRIFYFGNSLRDMITCI